MALNPKLALIPSGYKENKIYSVLPSDGIGDFDFSRLGTGATRVNKSGLIETVSAHVPRLNYPMIDGVVSGCPSLLLEPQRLQLIRYSEDLSQSYWWDANVERTGGFTSPAGDNSAYLVRKGSSSLTYLTTTGIDLQDGATYTISFYAKRKTVSNLRMKLQERANDYTDYFFEDIYLTSEWQRYEVSGVKGSDGNDARFVISGIDDDVEFYLWGVQLELGFYATSYIPNYGSALGTTRSAETANGSGDADTFNDSEGVLMAEISALNNSDTINPNRGISISSGSTNNTIFIYYQSSLNVLSCILTSNGTTQFSHSTTLFDVDDYLKIALKYKQNDFALWVNGFEIATDTSGNTPIGLNELAFDNGAGNDDFYGNAKQIQYFDTALTDTDLETLTSWVSFQEMAEGQLYSVE